MSTFGVTVGERSDQGRDEFLRYYNAAIEVPSSVTSELESISKETNIFLIVGVIERGGNTLYCTTVFIDPKDGYLGKHRKLTPTAAERFIWGQGDATTLPVMERSFTSSREKEHVKAKLATAICW